MKERFGDDRQKMGQAMMELHKKAESQPSGWLLTYFVTDANLHRIVLGITGKL
ncbi:hypothetical protein PEC18_19685 [Paucibacter sp. O1-1]|nr:hypothetical protein [Paucibacter sp. O1-1]MDA3827993.1 hypothetical protein [Paucibacter sp. O1-1]